MDLKYYGIRYGVVAGVATAITYHIFYMWSKSAYFGLTASVITWIIYFVCMTLASRDTQRMFLDMQRETGEAYRFSIALQAPFLVFLIAQLIYYLHYWLMFNVFDTGMVDLARIKAMEAVEKSANMLGSILDDDSIDKMLMAADEQDYRVTFRSALFSLAFSLIGGFILSSVYALIYRKENVRND